jgi:hypothetical protein
MDVRALRLQRASGRGPVQHRPGLRPQRLARQGSQQGRVLRPCRDHRPADLRRVPGVVAWPVQRAPPDPLPAPAPAAGYWRLFADGRRSSLRDAGTARVVGFTGTPEPPHVPECAARVLVGVRMPLVQVAQQHLCPAARRLESDLSGQASTQYIKAPLHRHEVEEVSPRLGRTVRSPGSSRWPCPAWPGGARVGRANRR